MRVVLRARLEPGAGVGVFGAKVPQDAQVLCIEVADEGFWLHVLGDAKAPTESGYFLLLGEGEPLPEDGGELAYLGPVYAPRKALSATVHAFHRTAPPRTVVTGRDGSSVGVGVPYRAGLPGLLGSSTKRRFGDKP